MTFITIYALFGDDIRTSSFSKSSDDVFYSLATICLCLFLLEFILCCFLKTDYIFSFYFWLDLVSTLSLIPDIGWIWDPIIGVSDDSTPRDSSKLKSISQTSKAGTRTSRVIRIIRIVRLIRIARLYKNAKNVLSKEVSDNEDDAEIYIPSESKVGKRLGDLTIKRVITLVLTMLFVMPLFDIEY